MYNQDNNRYLIACDLDGTLLNSKSQLSEETIQRIKAIIDKGHVFCIVTGRPLRGSIDIYKQLGLKTLMANYNGSYISNPSDKSFDPINMTFNKEIVKAILKDEYIAKNISNAVVESDNVARILHDDLDPQVWKSFIDIFHVPVKDLNNKNSGVIIQKENDEIVLPKDVNALLLNVSNKQLFDSMVFHIKKIAPTLAVRSWSARSDEKVEVIEINSAFADKSMALRYLSSFYGIPLDRCVAFGDGENDLTMLNQATYGFAMKNGTRTAKLMARHITKHTNDDNGVAWELEYILEQLYCKR